MNKIKPLGQAIVILISILMVSCSTTTPQPESESAPPLEKETTVTPPPLDYVFPIGLQTLVANLVDVLLSSHAIGNNNPLVAFGEVKDKTSANLDVKEISNQIREQLTNSGKVRLVIDDDDHEINEEKEFRLQNNSRPPKHRFDKLKSMNYRLIAVIYDTPLKKYNYDMAAHYYRITLSLLDKSNGDLIWIDEYDNVRNHPKSSTKQ